MKQPHAAFAASRLAHSEIDLWSIMEKRFDASEFAESPGPFL
jgi:hypothetical protein